MIVKIKCNFRAGGDPLLFASRNLQDDGATVILEHGSNWENRVLSISQLSRNMGEDKSYEISGISIEFADTDRFFRKWMSGENRYITGRTVEIFSDNDTLIYTGTVEKWQFSEDAFTLTINDKLSGLDTVISDVISADDYENPPEKSIGQVIPLVYGDLQGEAGAVKCWKVADGKFVLANHHCFVGQTIRAFLEDKTELSNPTLENNIEDGRTYVLCGSDAGDSETIFVNVKGKTDTQGLLIEDPVTAICEIITDAGMTYNSTQMEAARAIMMQRNYTIAAVIDKQKNLKDVLKEFCYCFDSDFYIDKANRIVINLLNWSLLEPVKSFNREQIIDFQLNELPEEIRNKVQYKYNYDWASGDFLKTPVYSSTASIANWGEFYESNEPLELLYVPDEVTAYDVLQRFILQRKNPKRIATITIPLEEFSGVDVADVIQVNHPNAIDENPRKYQVRRVAIDFSGDVVEVEAIDITSFTGGVFVFGDRANIGDGEGRLKADWQSAVDTNDATSQAYGYLADRLTGYFANGTDYGKVLY